MTSALHAEHVADLARSGLTAEDGDAARIASLDAAEVSSLVGFPVRSGGYSIPYPGTNAVRVRLVPPHVFADGKTAKYLSPKGAAVRLYVPPGVLDELHADLRRVVYVVEGEKKALATRKALGVCVVGLAGVDAWSCKKRPSGVVQDLEEVRPLLAGRRVVIAFDSDVRTNANVAGAAYRFAAWLRDQADAVPSWAFPESDGDAKVGMDDLIVAQGVDAARAVLDAPCEPMEPTSFVFRELVRRTPTREPGAAFVGTTLFERLRDVLAKAPATMRAALAEEARVALGLTVPDRAALVGEATKAARDDVPSDAKGDKLQGRKLTFVDPEPWPDPVDGAALLDDLRKHFERYVVLPAHGASALALWTLHSWTHDAFETSPALGVTSPVKRCGKSRVLDALEPVVRRPFRTGGATAALVFRVTDVSSPTLLMDEADSYLPGDEQLRGIINTAHTKAGAWTARTVGDDFEPRRFSTWAPIALAGIGSLPDTVRDRAIVLALRRKRKGEGVARLRSDRVFRDAEPLRRKAARWAKDHEEELREADPDTPGVLDDRAADGWRPLLALADLAGDAWPNRARTAAVAISAGRDAGEDESLGVKLLLDCRTAFGDADRFPSSALVQKLNDMEDRPWAEVGKNDKPLSAPTLARLLRPFGVTPRTIRQPSGETAKGYLRESFADAWATYTASEPTSATGTPSHVNGQAGYKLVSPPSQGARVTDQQPLWNAGATSIVTPLRVENPGTPDVSLGDLFDREERAAIREYDGGQSRADAERGAEIEFDGGRR